nr:tetratricopeptide repeat protein [Leptospira interrogans]
MENSNRNPGQIQFRFSFFLRMRIKTSVFMRLNIRYVSFSFFLLLFFVFCSSDEEMIWEARDSISKGNTAEAMRLYEIILKKNPTHLEANRTLGMILADSGVALNSAAFYLERAESSLPGDSSLLLYLLEIHLQEKDRDKTKRILEKFSKSKDKEMENYAIFLRDCLLDRKKNQTEFNRFKTSEIPAFLPPARRLFLKCELSLYSVSKNSEQFYFDHSIIKQFKPNLFFSQQKVFFLKPITKNFKTLSIERNYLPKITLVNYNYIKLLFFSNPDSFLRNSHLQNCLYEPHIS